MRKEISLFLTGIALSIVSYSQPSPGSDNIERFPHRYIKSIGQQSRKLEDNITRQSLKYLQRLSRQEAKLAKQLAKTDSAAAARLFNGQADRYNKLAAQLQQPAGNAGTVKGEYLPYWDSIRSSLAFLESQKDLLSGNASMQQQLQHAGSQVNNLQYRLQQSEQVKAFIRQRKEQINNALGKVTGLPDGLKKQYQAFQKEAYYYQQQIREYRELLNDPDKLVKKAIAVLGKTKAFQQFMANHSQLAGLFRLPASYAGSPNLNGLQTRSQVQQQMLAQLPASGPNVGQGNPQQLVQQTLQNAQGQLNTLKDKLNKLGGSGGGDLDMPEFKPNNQRTKSFWKRLELGTNIQSSRSGNFYPTTTDVGLSLGYKLSDKSVVGVGASYKAGWGRDIRHIEFTSEGVGLRSYIDVRMKKSFYLSGGLEYNYQQPFSELRQLEDYDQWQPSGLIGISKIVSLQSKFFKKTKLQLLWDFLSYEQVPRAQAIRFRVGYGF